MTHGLNHLVVYFSNSHFDTSGFQVSHTLKLYQQAFSAGISFIVGELGIAERVCDIGCVPQTGRQIDGKAHRELSQSHS